MSEDVESYESYSDDEGGDEEEKSAPVVSKAKKEVAPVKPKALPKPKAKPAAKGQGSIASFFGKK